VECFLIAVKCLFLLTIIAAFWVVIDSWRRDRRGKKMIVAAKEHQALFRFNNDKEVTGICIGRNFEYALSVRWGKEEDHEVNPWEKVILQVVPTYAFAENEMLLRPAHTGQLKDLEIFIDGAVEKLTGFKKSDVSWEDFEEARKIIFHRDIRLFVPYSGLSTTEGEKQYKKYGSNPWPEALEDLQKVVDLAFEQSERLKT